MAKHPHPLDTLKERKKKVDIYVKRLDKAGCKGDFVDMYKQIQKDFEKAVECVRTMFANDTGALPIFDVVWRSEQLKAYAEYLQTRPDFQERSNKDLAIDYCDSL